MESACATAGSRSAAEALQRASGPQEVARCNLGILAYNQAGCAEMGVVKDAQTKPRRRVGNLSARNSSHSAGLGRFPTKRQKDKGSMAYYMMIMCMGIHVRGCVGVLARLYNLLIPCLCVFLSERGLSTRESRG